MPLLSRGAVFEMPCLERGKREGRRGKEGKRGMR